jgi:alanyl-tRNA synthetase
MLGTWSFGDYFQEEAISWAFELLVNVFGTPVCFCCFSIARQVMNAISHMPLLLLHAGLKPERMYATYFEGDAKENLAPDLKAKEIWGRFLPEDHILPGNKKDNFWEMGETGPCGPCSEIHYDRIGGRNAADRVNKDDPMVIEIWNLVFMAFNREPSGNLKPLPAKHVDTGMGFERLLSILQNKMSNYDTDVFMPLFKAIQDVTGAAPYEGKYGEEDPQKKDMAYRVIADHIRTLTFSITDGALPGVVGRGFVLRRILRRAVRYGRDFLGAKVGFFSKLVPAVVENFGSFFPELKDSGERVAMVLYNEELKFATSYEKGISTFTNIVKDMKPGDVIPGDKVFLLYNTSGFPDDLTRIMGEERGLKIDEAGFHKLLDELRRSSRQKQKAKAALNSLKLDAEHVAELKGKFTPTDDSHKYQIFNIEAKVIALFNGKNLADSKLGVSDNLVRFSPLCPSVPNFQYSLHSY